MAQCKGHRVFAPRAWGTAKQQANTARMQHRENQPETPTTETTVRGILQQNPLLEGYSTARPPLCVSMLGQGFGQDRP